MIPRKYLASLVWLALWPLTPVRAQLVIEPTVTVSAGTFHYQYAITNWTPIDVSIVTLSGFFPANNAVQNLTAPSGFSALFDPGISLLSFFEDTKTFAVGTTSGPFSFDSPYAPSFGAYEAVDITGNLLTGRSVVAGAPITAVPEPATTAVFGSLLLIGLMLHRKFRPQKS